MRYYRLSFDLFDLSNILLIMASDLSIMLGYDDIACIEPLEYVYVKYFPIGTGKCKVFLVKEKDKLVPIDQDYLKERGNYHFLKFRIGFIKRDKIEKIYFEDIIFIIPKTE